MACFSSFTCLIFSNPDNSWRTLNACCPYEPTITVLLHRPRHDRTQRGDHTQIMYSCFILTVQPSDVTSWDPRLSHDNTRKPRGGELETLHAIPTIRIHSPTAGCCILFPRSPAAVCLPGTQTVYFVLYFARCLSRIFTTILISCLPCPSPFTSLGASCSLPLLILTVWVLLLLLYWTT